MNLNNLDININELIDMTCEMMDKCENIVSKAVDAMVSKDLEASKDILVLDDEIDDLREYIREKSIELMALKQPLAKDLRIIYALGSIAMELERVGDYAVNIAMETIKIGTEEHVEKLIDIPKMKDVTIGMLKSAKNALKNNDPKLAHKTGLQDDVVDELYSAVHIDALSAMHKDKHNINQGVKLLFVGRYLERIGDHITNICEFVIYAINGEMIEID
ncbi:phosphate signaling complex protein PhoU [Romboutsia lituseburensis]|uniref:Phosphate-specific transport system accessory protein PhoU n=1 Tax=Romboutsia lituseburensis DSM 797 TaxID=1121325 RepID=A0A1G9N7V0_9FIRM|nr:phosphate signaling complex protein PhoU [Romboutsia lituseburensis]CEH34179.1 Phosphate-specific transport system accessory protein PhoU [Romboutsia lituseburensis]SDL81925.1 phosphate uptake regulator, PhoU [Romboutsia lituseburensis DSM 797]